MKFWRRNQRDSDLDRELRSHLEQEAAENREAGASPSEARHAALRAFGNVALVSEDTRAAWRRGSVERLLQDLRYALRLFRRSPAFTTAAVLTLALGIGSAATLLSIVYDGLIRNRSDNDARSEVILGQYPERHLYSYRFSMPEYLELAAQTQAFESMGALLGFDATLSMGDYPERILGTRTTASMFQESQMRIALGRGYRPDEDVPGGPRVVLISYELWKRKFGLAADILGQTIVLNQQAHTIIGVMPEHSGFFGGDVTVPLQADAGSTDRSNRYLWVIGLRRRGVSTSQANASLEAIARRWAEQYGTTNPEYHGLRLAVRNTYEWVHAGIMPAIYVLLGAVGLLLLICSANVANLLLARATARSREIVIRMALGAARARIIRQLLTESVSLAWLGGALGVLVSMWGVRLAASLIPYDWLPSREGFRLEPIVALAVCALSMLIGVLFGLVPALQLLRSSVAHAMQAASPRAGGDRSGRWSRNLLIVAETAMAVVILAGAGLMARSYRALMELDLGFRPDRLLTMRISLPPTRYRAGIDVARFYRTLLPHLSALPGVEGAALSSNRPLVDRAVDLTLQDFTIEGRPSPDARSLPNADVTLVSADYFPVMGARLLAGRWLTDDDTAQTTPVAVINQTMAGTYWPGTSAIGQRIRLGDQNPAPADASETGAGSIVTIVGVVADVRQIRIMEAPVRPQFYIPVEQRPGQARGMNLVVRSSMGAAGLTAAVRGAMQSVDSQQPLYEVMTMDEAVANALGPRRLVIALLGFFAAASLTLVTVGLYAVLAYAVARRTQEIGLRMALGARPSAILGGVVAQGMSLASAGLAVGTAAALALTRALRDLIYGVSAADPLTFSAVIAILAAVALAACVVPSLRAMRLDPVVALRHE